MAKAVLIRPLRPCTCLPLLAVLAFVLWAATLTTRQNIISESEAGLFEVEDEQNMRKEALQSFCEYVDFNFAIAVAFLTFSF